MCINSFPNFSVDEDVHCLSESSIYHIITICSNAPIWRYIFHQHKMLSLALECKNGDVPTTSSVSVKWRHHKELNLFSTKQKHNAIDNKFTNKEYSLYGWSTHCHRGDTISTHHRFGCLFNVAVAYSVHHKFYVGLLF